ncbi:4'-phosphopantetheinyl transferase Sfp [anaerobic digester metagenome]
MVVLLMMDGDVLKDTAKFQTAMELVGEQRRAKVERMAKESSKRLSLCAGLLLRYAFLKENEIALYDEIKVTKKGMLYLPNQEYFFSLSHSGRFAICSFSHETIGCDIEKIRDKLPKVAKIFSPEEEQFFYKLDEKDKKEFFFQLWTWKESVTKWMGKGIAYPFDSFSVMDGLRNRNIIVVEGKKLCLKSFHMEDYIISLCNERGNFPQEIKKIDWNILTEN